MRQGRQAVDAMWRLREVWDLDGGDLAAGGDMAPECPAGRLKAGFRSLSKEGGGAAIFAGMRREGGAFDGGAQ